MNVAYAQKSHSFTFKTGIFRAMVNIIVAALERSARRRAYARLAALDERTLRDIGLDRADLLAASYGDETGYSLRGGF